MRVSKSRALWLSVHPHLESDFKWFTFREQQQKQYYFAFICRFIIPKHFSLCISSVKLPREVRRTERVIKWLSKVTQLNSLVLFLVFFRMRLNTPPTMESFGWKNNSEPFFYAEHKWIALLTFSILHKVKWMTYFDGNFYEIFFVSVYT